MTTFSKLHAQIKKKGFRRTFKTLWERYVFFHWELLWMERDLITPVSPHKLRPYTSVSLVAIDIDNVIAFTKYFGDRVEAMRELASEGHTGHMYLDDEGDAIAFIWASERDYHDRHYYGCWFPVKEGEFFEFGGEMTRPYFGTSLSVDAQIAIWKTMQAKGFNKVVDVCETHNIPALKLHIRMGYHEQGRIMHVYGLFGRWRLFRETHYSGSRLDTLRNPMKSAIQVAA